MTYVEYADNLERIKYLVERKQAGTPEELAKKLAISERTVLRMIKQLRNHGCFIVFNRSRHAYEVRE